MWKVNEVEQDVLELKKEVSSLTASVANISQGIGDKIVVNLGRVVTTSEEHAAKLNRIIGDLAKINQTLTSMQESSKRIVNKLNETVLRIEALEKKPKETPEDTESQSEMKEFMDVSQSLIKDIVSSGMSGFSSVTTLFKKTLKKS